MGVVLYGDHELLVGAFGITLRGRIVCVGEMLLDPPTYT